MKPELFPNSHDLEREIRVAKELLNHFGTEQQKHDIAELDEALQQDLEGGLISLEQYALFITEPIREIVCGT